MDMTKTVGALALLLAVGCGPQEKNDFTDVRLDPANASGVQFETPVFEVPQGEEVQDCYFFAMPDLDEGRPYFIDRVRIGSNPGSHHANVFRVKTVLALGTPDQGDFVHNGECFKSGNWADWPLVANNQSSDPENGIFDWRLPEGVGYRFSPGERIMVQTHFVNAATQETPFKGKVVLDLYRSSMEAPMEMGTLFASQQSIRICRSNPTPSYTGGCTFRHDGITISAANGHFHSRGMVFDVFKWDGISPEVPPAERDHFYRSTEWDDPPMTIYPDAAAMALPANHGIRWTCDYRWFEPDESIGGCAAIDALDPQQEGDCCYTFGPLVETSEHCNVFLYYYPKVDGDRTCF
jgi:hypothetical protein